MAVTLGVTLPRIDVYVHGASEATVRVVFTLRGPRAQSQRRTSPQVIGAMSL